MSCCCPPAISALFCLWARSGFSKSSVAGALTFFPPDPPLYKFTKVPPHQEASNNDHSNDEDDANKDSDERDKIIQRNVHNTAVDKNVYKDTRKDPQETHALVKDDDDDDDDDQEGNSNIGTATTTTAATASSRNTTNTTHTATGPSSPLRPAQDAGRPLPSPPPTTTSPSSSTIPPTSTTDPSLTTPIQPSPSPAAAVEANVHPATALMQRSLQLRQEAKHKNRQDAQDASKGMKYTFHPDPRLVPPPGYSGSIEAVKIPHLQHGTSSKTSSSSKLSLSCRNGSHDGSDINHVACVIYRIREDRVTERTKTIIYSHGNATDIGAMHFMQVVIAKGLRCNVVMYDYSGYGESGGFAVEENTYKDIEAVYQYVLDHVVPNGNERNIILYGQSVGGGPSCYLAAKKKDVGGLILHSAFMSGMRVLTPSRALACLDIFPNILRIQKVQCPVMIIHGMLDEEVGFEHGVALHDAVPDHCKRNPWWVRDRGHNDITDGRQKILEYIQKLKTFLDSLMED